MQLADQMQILAAELAGEPTERGREEWRFRARGSLAVVVAGPKRGSWYDHEAGVGGHALQFVAHMRREAQGAAQAWARAWLGLSAERSAVSPRMNSVSQNPGPSRSGSLELGLNAWREARSPISSPVEAYLRSRGLGLEAEPPLRFHPLAWRNPKFGPCGPAMLALMTDPVTAKPCGVHVTYLRSDGSGKAEGERPKIMLGRAGCIRLVPDEDVCLGLGICEGIETGLSVMQVYGWRPVWAATSAGGLGGFPVLPGISELTVFADPDGAGAAAARRCAARWGAEGRGIRVWLPPAGQDFNDLIQGRAA